MAIAYRSTAQSAVSSSIGPDGSANVTPSKPSGTVDNDIMTMIASWEGDGTFQAGGGSPSVDTPSGWTSLGTAGPQNGFTNAPYVAGFRKVAASEGSSYTVTGRVSHNTNPCVSSGGKFIVDIVSASGGDPNTPVDLSHFDDLGTTSANPVALSITTTKANGLLIAGVVSSGSVTGAPAGMTDIYHGATPISPGSHALAYKALGGAGATGNQTFARTAGGKAEVSFQIALNEDQRPATPTMNSGTTTYHVSTAGGTASVTLSATTTDPQGDNWHAVFTNGGGGSGSTVASGASSTKTNSLGPSVNVVTATGVDAGGNTSASSASQTITVWDIPTAPTINTALDSHFYDRSIALSATATISDDTYYVLFEYQKDGGAWTSIGTGSVVASGAPSLLTWDTHALAQGSYKVRATGKCHTHDVAGATTTESGTFLLAHSGLFGFL